MEAAAKKKQRKLLPPPLRPLGDAPKNAKYTKDEIEERRRYVAEAVIRGISASTIANQLGVHRNTIVGDIREIRKQNAEKVSQSDMLEEVGELASFFEKVAADAMFEVSANSHPMAKVSFMSMAMKAKADKMKLLTQVGVIPHAPRRHEKASSVLFGDDIDLDNMQVEELARLRDQVLNEIYDFKDVSLEEPDPDKVVEVEVVEKVEDVEQEVDDSEASVA
jgi:hypothetical protein